MKESGPDAEDGKDDTHTHTQKKDERKRFAYTQHTQLARSSVFPLSSAQATSGRRQRQKVPLFLIHYGGSRIPRSGSEKSGLTRD